MKLLKVFYLALLCLSISLVSCSGEDGKDGIDGINGVDGQDGADGEDGIGTNGQDGADGQDGTDGQDGVDGADGQDGEDGMDGVGFDELTQYGAVTLNLSGTRPDGIAFEDSAIYQFTPIDPDDFDDYNIVTITPNGDDTEYFFNFRRFFSSPDGTYNTTYLDWELTVVNPGEETENIQSVVIYVKHGVVGDDNKYFMINEPYESGGVGISEMVFTDMVFDPNAGNHLSFSYAFTVDAANNDSGNELSVSGIVDINLLEEIVP